MSAKAAHSTLGKASTSLRSWWPRSPAPIKPMRMRSLAPSTREVGYARKAAVPSAACLMNSRLVFLAIYALLWDVLSHPSAHVDVRTRPIHGEDATRLIRSTIEEAEKMPLR